MKQYMAKLGSGKGSVGVYLSNSNMFDKYLGYGADIYEIEDGKETLIATPKDGFLVERPVFPIPQSSTRS